MFIRNCAKLKSCKGYGWLARHPYCVRKCRQFSKRKPAPRSEHRDNLVERTPYWAVTPEGNYQWMWRGRDTTGTDGPVHRGGVIICAV